MKKLFLIALGLVFSLNTFAQEVEEAPAKKPSNKDFVTNKFWDNWEISLGVGPATEDMANKPGNGHNDHGSFWHRISWEGNFSITKWFHPIWGARLQLSGGQFKGYRSVASENAEHTPYIFLHTDFMVNLSNWIGGYREDRVYYAVPFFGFGYQAQDFTKAAHNHGYGTNNEFAFTAGLLNKFRVCKALDINLELKGWFYPESDHALHSSVGGTYVNAWSATAGITYRFNKRDWNRKPTYKGPDAAAYAALLAEKDAALALAAAEAEALREAAEKAPAVATTETIFLGGKTIIFFSLDKSNLTEKECLRLDIKAKQIMEGPAGKVYHIEGHADVQTGTPTHNQKLSDARAKRVYDYLVKKGVNPDQLTYKGEGDKVQPYPSMQTNRVVIID